MKDNQFIKIGLLLLTIIIIIISTLTPMVVGFNSGFTEKDDYLEKLTFVLGENYESFKVSYYKKNLLRNQTSHDEVVAKEPASPMKPVKPVKTPMISMSGDPMYSAWPMKCYDTRHTSQSPYNTVDICAEIWRYKTSWQIEGGPIIDNNGVIYFGCFNRYFYALYPNSTLKWKYKTDGWIWSTPAIAEDETIYVSCWDGCKLYAFYPDGAKKWDIGLSGNGASSPVIAEDGTIYVGAMGPGNKGRISAINPNGTRKWYYDTGYWIVSDPAIGDDGTIYIGSGDTYLYAMYPNGTLRWRFKTGDIIKAHPSIAEDGIIYIASFDHNLYAIYPNGTLKWKRSSGYNGCSSVGIDEDGTLYFDSLVAAYPNNGTTKWSIDIPNIDHSSLAISADGIIYAGAGNYIIAIDSNNGSEKWRKNIANKWVESSPCIAEDGTVYIGSTSDDAGYSYGFLHAFGVGELTADANGPYYGLTNQPIQFTGSSEGGYSPHSYFWDFGDTHTSEEQNPTHTYTNPGNYTLLFTVTDNKSNTVIDTTYAWIQSTNTAPDKPTINGPTHGAIGITYDYTFSATDPDNSIIYLYVDWGDNTNSGWVGPYNSGQQVNLGHSWSEQDTYTIKAKAKDPYDAEGPWGTLDVTMPKNKAFNFNLNLLEMLLERFPILQRLYLL